jgi:hypothetical protein
VTAREMIKKQLAEMKADGLVNMECECGCHISDLCPCEDLNLQECLAARWISCIDCERSGSCKLQDSRGNLEGYFVPIPELGEFMPIPEAAK